MGQRLPRVTAREMVRVVTRLGFALARQSGSHQIYKNSEGKRVTIPAHAKKILHPKIVKSILRDAGVTVEEFRRLL